MEIRVDLPRDHPGGRELLKAEVREGLRLRDDGTILLVCGIAEGLGNIGIWSATDEDTLREIIDALPLREFMTYEVTPLTKYSSESAEPKPKSPRNCY